MLNKEQIKDASKCKLYPSCHGCSLEMIAEIEMLNCVEESAQTALQLLNRVETAETILRDILQSGNVTACKKEIEKFLSDIK